MRHEFLDLSCPKCVDLFALVRFLMSLTPPTLNDATRTSLPFKPPPLGSSKFGSPDGSVSDLDGMGVRSSSTVEENKLDEILLLVGQVCAINLWISQMNNHIPSITNPCVPSRSGSQSLIKNLGTLAACIPALEAWTRSASRKSGSPAGSWPLLSHNGGSTAAGSHDPAPVDDGRNVRD